MDWMSDRETDELTDNGEEIPMQAYDGDTKNGIFLVLVQRRTLTY